METMLLRKVCEIIMGQAPDGTTYNTDGQGVPLIAGAADLGDIFPEPNKFTSAPTKLSSVGDIILCIRATIGDRNWSDKKYCLGRGVAGLRPIKNFLDSNYLWFWLEESKIELAKKATGSTFKQVSRDDIESLEIPLPPLAEQKRIAAILDKADAIRRKRQEAIRLADELLRSVFLDMFGDPVTNPKGWEVKPLSNVAQIQGGLQLTPKRDPYPLELPYLRVANVYSDKLVLDEIKYIKVTQEEAKRVALQKGDILVVEGHGNREEIGRTSVWDASITHCLHQNHLIRIRLDNNKVDPVFISAYLNSSGGRQQLFKFGKTTSGLNTISISNVKETSVLLPPIELQKQYESLVYKNKEIIRKNTEQLEEINKMFNSLVQRAFKGEL